VLSASLLVALLAAFLAGCISGLTGFGLALISVPLFLFVYDPKTTVVITAVLSLFINVAVVWDSWRDADRRMVLALLLPALAGVVVGVEILRVVDPEYIRLGVGIVVVFSALLLLREVRLPGAGSRWGPVVAGSTSGALSTSTALAGPPIVLLLASRGFPKRVFVARAPSTFSLRALPASPFYSFAASWRESISGSSSLLSPPAFSARSLAPRF
jgi:uncharacterized protein